MATSHPVNEEEEDEDPSKKTSWRKETGMGTILDVLTMVRSSKLIWK